MEDRGLFADQKILDMYVADKGGKGLDIRFGRIAASQNVPGINEGADRGLYRAEQGGKMANAVHSAPLRLDKKLHSALLGIGRGLVDKGDGVL